MPPPDQPATFIDVCTQVKDFHVAKYLQSFEVYKLSRVAKGLVEGAEISVVVTPWYDTLRTREDGFGRLKISLQEGRSLAESGAIIRKIEIDPEHPYETFTGFDKSNFHNILKQFCGECPPRWMSSPKHKKLKS